MSIFVDTGQFCIFAILINLNFILSIDGIILSGAPHSYARYPKWAHSFENSLSLELKTKQSNGLILYTDDGNANGNFYALTIADGKIQLDFRLGDNTNDFGPRRLVNTIRIEEVLVDDDRWHSLSIFQSWENVKLELDHVPVFKILNQRSFVFGDIHKNSDVFIGGVPADLHILSVMSSPLRRHSRHLAGNIRNLMYRQYPQGITSPQLLDAIGARQNEDDNCGPKAISSREQFVCHNDGVCYNTNDGPKCDCSFSEFEGNTCEIEKSDSELTFSGNEWIGYDVTNSISSQIRAKRENFTMSFKTVHGSAMLFFAGDEKSFLHLMIENGALIATSKFDGTEPRLIRMFNSYPGERYDDDLWHNVVLERSLTMMTLIVDGRKDEIRQYAPELDWMTNAFAFLGALPKENPMRGINRTPFRGCMKKAKYEADAQRVLFINIADQGFGENTIKTGGELSFSCKNPSQPPDILSFTTGKGHLALPKWNSLSSGSMSFQFRSSEQDGLIFYHGVMQNNATDFLAFELIDGHLYMIINLGSGHVRLQTTSRKISSNSGEWHSVNLERISRTGSVVVDTVKTDFHTPGVSSNLIVDDPIYLGGLPKSPFVTYPPAIWSISLGRGFQGCIKNFRINGINAKIASIYEHSNSTGIALGCSMQNSLSPCEPNPCHNYGRCEPTISSFKCDCSLTGYEGERCNIEPSPVELDGEQAFIHQQAHTVVSEAEHVQFRFKTDFPSGVILDTKSNKQSLHRFTVYIDNGALNVFFRNHEMNNSFTWGHGLSDNRWHSAQIRRLGDRIILYLDGSWGQSIILPSPIAIERDEVGAARTLHPPDETPKDQNFRGSISKLILNDIDFMDSLRREGRSGREHKGQRNIRPKPFTVSFTNTSGYLVYSPKKLSSLAGSFRVQFKFQTLIRSALLLANIPEDGSDQITIELLNGRIKYSYKGWKVDESIESPKLPHGQHLSDLRWHNLQVYQDAKSGSHVLSIDNTTVTLSNDALQRKRTQLSGILLIGGAPNRIRPNVKGFRGCLSSVKINEKLFDLIEEAEQKESAIAGCSGPVVRCSPSACSNGGRCIQQWSSIRCDCTLTAHSGERCNEASSTLTFTGEPSAVFFEYPENERPSTTKDYLVLAVKTTAKSGVLFSVECVADMDFLAAYLEKGYLHMKFNLGSRTHIVSYNQEPIADGEKHTIKLFRDETNVTLQIDKKPALRYRPKSTGELVLLNMQWRLIIGGATTKLHLEKEEKIKRSIQLYDPFVGEISGLNFNGIMIIDLYNQGSNRVHSVGPVEQTHIVKPATKPKPEDDVMPEHFLENPSEALIESIGPGCLSIEEQESCYIESTDNSGFFTPVLPSSISRIQTAPVTPAPTRATIRITAASPRSSAGEAATTTITSILASTTAKLAAQPQAVKTSTAYTYPPVRPTTPMGELITTTLKNAEPGEFPRTPFISVASVTVILFIAIIVFCVFKCRQSPAPNDHYPMVINGKSASGYTPIATELSPPLGMEGRTADPATQPLLPRTPVSGNGYQPLNGAIIPNGNGVNGGLRSGGGSIPGGGGPIPPKVNGNANPKKKDFKEWYV